jgi:hypothetical protein
MDWVAMLAEAVEWRSLELDISWNELEANLGSPFPMDFKRFCEVFGRGEFCDGLVVYLVPPRLSDLHRGRRDVVALPP